MPPSRPAARRPRQAQERQLAARYMERFDAQKWYDDPVATCIAGKPVEGGESGPTYDNFGRENGSVLHGDIDGILDHLRDFDSVRDQRSTVRSVERALFTDHAAALIGNQTLDFGKQDGVTEIEEALEASEVERRLVDQLLDDEEKGVLRIERALCSSRACRTSRTSWIYQGRRCAT